jgi:ribosomal protein S14
MSASRKKIAKSVLRDYINNSLVNIYKYTKHNRKNICRINLREYAQTGAKKINKKL